MELFVESKSYIYDITDMCSDISWTDTLNDGAGYLEFSYVFHEQIGLVECGDPVRLTDDDQSSGIFFGIIFNVSMDQDKVIKARAYDRIRYCKTKDTIVVEGDTINSLMVKMCRFFQFPAGVNTPSGFRLPDSVCTDKTWLDIIYTAISDTLMGTGRYFCLRDENGEICLQDMEDLQLPVVLGDGSLVYDYSYSTSIDDEFYNQVKLVSANENTGRAEVFMVNSDSIEKYGLLQYYEVLDKNMDSAKAWDKAQNLLRLYNREMESLSLSCIGDLSIRAGCSIYGSIEDIQLERRLIVKSVVHNFLPVYTMDVEVII